MALFTPLSCRASKAVEGAGRAPLADALMVGRYTGNTVAVPVPREADARPASGESTSLAFVISPRVCFCTGSSPGPLLMMTVLLLPTMLTPVLLFPRMSLTTRVCWWTEAISDRPNRWRHGDGSQKRFQPT